MLAIKPWLFDTSVSRIENLGSQRQDFCSLVPRPFPPPVFDRLQYAKTEGGGLGERVTWVMLGGGGGGRGGRCPTKKLKVLLVISCPRT